MILMDVQTSVLQFYISSGHRGTIDVLSAIRKAIAVFVVFCNLWFVVSSDLWFVISGNLWFVALYLI